MQTAATLLPRSCRGCSRCASADGRGQPLHYRQIYKKLQARGIQVPGQDPLKNVGAHLSNDQRFVSDGKGNWRLASWGPEMIATPRDERAITATAFLPAVAEIEQALI